MPAIRRGKQGGIKQFLKGRKSYKTTYTMYRNKDDFVTFDIWIICKYKKGKADATPRAVNAQGNAHQAEERLELNIMFMSLTKLTQI